MAYMARLVLFRLLCLALASTAWSQESLEDDSLQLLTRRSELQSRSPKIPANLLFNYKFNLLEATKAQLNGDESLKLLQKNIQHTISVSGKDAKVYFWDDQQCIDGLKRLRGFDGERLAEGFQRIQGRFKSDLCRLAQLWQHGGYYFDTDIVPVTSMREFLARNTTFATVKGLLGKQIFQAFLAATPHNPIIGENLRAFTEWFAAGNRNRNNLGTHVMYDTLEKLDSRLLKRSTIETGSQRIQLLKESSLDHLKHRQGFGSGHLLHPDWKGDCNVAVVDEETKGLVMYSRVLSPSHGDVACNQAKLIKRKVKAHKAADLAR